MTTRTVSKKAQPKPQPKPRPKVPLKIKTPDGEATFRADSVFSVQMRHDGMSSAQMRAMLYNGPGRPRKSWHVAVNGVNVYNGFSQSEATKIYNRALAYIH